MSDVQFEEERFDTVNRFRREPAPSGMVGFLIKRGIVKDENQANYVLIGVIIITISITIFVFFNGARTPSAPSGNKNIEMPIPQASR